MTATHLLTVAVLGALLYGGNAAWTSYLEHQQHLARLAAAQSAEEQATRRLELMARALTEGAARRAAEAR